MAALRPTSARPAVLLLAGALLLAPWMALAHAPNPTPEKFKRLLVDQNDDNTIWSPGAGHDLVKVEVEEAWLAGEGELGLVVRVVYAGGYTATEPDGELREDFTFKVGGRTYSRTVRTTDDVAYTHNFDQMGPKVEEVGDGHGDYSFEFTLRYSTLGAKVGERLEAFKIEGHHKGTKRDVIPGGAYNTLGQYQDSLSEDNSPIAENNQPYTLRGAAYKVGLAVDKASLQVAKDTSDTLKATVENKLPTTDQVQYLKAIETPPGWTVRFDKTDFELCGGCKGEATVTVGPSAGAAEGTLVLEVTSTQRGRTTQAVQLSFPPPPSTPLEIKDLAVDPGITDATVTWATTLVADGKVEWGPTAGYGSAASNASLATSHSLRLTALQPATTYHYRVVSSNGTATATSQDATFTTDPVPQLQVKAPAEGATLHGTVNVTLEVAHWTGPVDLLLDGQVLASLDAPYAHRWDTRSTGNGAHTLAARAGGFASANVSVTVDNPVQHAAKLEQGRVTPTSGDTTMTYEFSVRYVDVDGDEPTKARVVVDGQAHDLASDGGDVRTGRVYKLGLQLDAGQHAYYFQVQNAHEGMRFPAEGTQPGPYVDAPKPADPGPSTGTPGQDPPTQGGPDPGPSTPPSNQGSGASNEGTQGSGTPNAGGQGGASQGPGSSSGGSQDGGSGSAGNQGPGRQGGERRGDGNLGTISDEPLDTTSTMGPPEPRETPGPGLLAGLAALLCAAGLRRRNRAVLAGALLLALAAAAAPAAAHETQSAGDYTVVVGWAQEPPAAGLRNAIEVTITKQGAPVAGVNTLTTQVEYGPDSKTLTLTPRGGIRGVYDGVMIPTREGQYRVKLGGFVEEQAINLSFNKIEVVEPIGDFQFPAVRDAGNGPDPEVQQLRSRVQTLEQRLQALESKPDKAAPGFEALGALALLGGLAVALRSRRPR